ncbi:MAG TPA: hypothetical protein VEX87_10500 [Skermanella sp.]|nr:hypothetical protein [Skermanella sp.]
MPPDPFDIFLREIEQAVEDNIGKLRFCVIFRSGKCWMIVIGPKGKIESEKQVLPYIDKYDYFDKLSDNINKNIADLHTGDLTRIVIDVEIGAIYFSRITGSIDLLSMTYDQGTGHERDLDHSNVEGALRAALSKLL